jgi:hypothetical protein
MQDRKSYYYYFIAAVTDLVSSVRPNLLSTLGLNLASSLAVHLMSSLGRVLTTGDIKWSEIQPPSIFHLSFFNIHFSPVISHFSPFGFH